MGSQLGEEARRGSAGLPRAAIHRVAAGPAEDEHYMSAAGIALAAHGPVDRMRTNWPSMARVQPGRGALEILAAVVGCRIPGASEEAGGMELGLIPVQLWRVLPGAGERALHRPLVGGLVVVDL